MKIKNSISIFTDFDGTIVYKDIGDELFRDFGRLEPYHSMPDSGGSTISEYWRLACENLTTALNKSQIAEYALTFDVDPYFKPFAELCKEEQIELSIISDGFEEYIKPVLNNIGLGSLPVYCNRLIFSEGRLPSPQFTFASESCRCLCASCKRNSILTNTSPVNIIIFIGDGKSDFCAAEHSDIVFAKKKLAAYCNAEKIPHYTFDSFFDILRILKKVISEKKFRVRHQASLMRKKAFEIE